MKHTHTTSAILALILLALPLALGAQAFYDPSAVQPTAAQPAVQSAAAAPAVQEAAKFLPLSRLAVFSSGVGFFEHRGVLTGPVETAFSFDAEAVNDALKSLLVNDPASDFPTVRYASSSALDQALKSLKVDLSDNPGLARIFYSLKGAEVEIAAPTPVSGRILGVEYRTQSGGGQAPWLTLLGVEGSSPGIRAIAISDITSFTFKDSAITADLARALDLIMENRDRDERTLLISLPGEGSRAVSVSYVIPAPVWKVSYRLDLAGDPRLQGWAIVDNDSDTDWENIELSLVTGRPVSFIQNLYAPYHVTRPTVPLAIAGTAEARTYESGSAAGDAFFYMDAEAAMEEPLAAKALSMRAAVPAASSDMAAAGGVATNTTMQSAALQTASGQAAGDQFEFTFKNPVSLSRGQSAMLPLVEAAVKAEKTLVFSGANLTVGTSVNPAISVELTNTAGMKLPTGPITVYDGGTYAGDALIEFFPENEKRIISFGEDLSVTASLSRLDTSTATQITAVTISGGVMTLTRRRASERVYTARDASGEAKKLIIEHPITSGADLVDPAAYTEKTSSLYRFSVDLPAGKEISYKVREEWPVDTRVVLANYTAESLVSYAANGDIPANARAALTEAAALKRAADDAATVVDDLKKRRTTLVADQARARENLTAAGNGTAQGQEYLKRMASLDADIDAVDASIAAAEDASLAAKNAYNAYIAGLELQ